jgi:hypothetical protein
MQNKINVQELVITTSTPLYEAERREDNDTKSKAKGTYHSPFQIRSREKFGRHRWTFSRCHGDGDGDGGGDG